MNLKKKFSIFGLLAASVALTVGVFYFLNREREGVVKNLRDIPLHGELFNLDVKAEAIRYLYSPLNKRIVIAGKISRESFDAVCKNLDTSYIGYDRNAVNFRPTLPLEYLPKGQKILVAIGKVKPDERASYKIYFSDNDGAAEGDFCIDIGG